MRPRSAASESHSKTRAAFASSESSRRKSRRSVHAPFQERNTSATSEPTARNARAKQNEQPWPQPEITGEDEGALRTVPRNAKEIADPRSEKLQMPAEPARARPRHRGARGGGLVEREGRPERTHANPRREEPECGLGILGRRPRRSGRTEAKCLRRESHGLAAQTHGQALGVACEVVEPRFGQRERLDARRAESGTPAGRTGSWKTSVPSGTFRSRKNSSGRRMSASKTRMKS